MRGIIFFLLFLSTFTAIVHSSGCRHPKLNETGTYETKVYDLDDKLITNPITIDDVRSVGLSPGCEATFRISNNVDYNLSFILNYQIHFVGGGIGFSADQLQDRQITIELYPREVRRIREYVDWLSATCTITQPIPKPIFISNTQTNVKKEQIVTEICPGKKDGASCNIGTECDGTFCVEGICNSVPTCYQNNCQCLAGKKQCPDNSKCIMVGVLPDGQKYTCLPDECKGRNANKDGICTTPTDWPQILIVLVSIILVGVLIWKFVEDEKTRRIREEREAADRRKREEHDRKIAEQKGEENNLVLKRQNIQEEMQLILQKNDDIEREELKLKRLKDIREKTKDEDEKILRSQDKIKEDKQELEQLIQDHQKAHEKLTDIQESRFPNYKYYWRNPKYGYYPCVVSKSGEKTDTLIHVKIAYGIYQRYKEKFQKLYPSLIYPEDFEIHHIDRDPDNFDDRNLAIISKHEHEEVIQHKNIGKGDWESGIRELKRVNIKQPHISELKY